MQNFLITGFKNGVWKTQIIKTIFECVEKRAKEQGFTVITNIEQI